MSCDGGCCNGVQAATPLAVHNRPGLAQIAHRPGDWAAYVQSLQAVLSSARFPELAALTTRASDDASLALCDAWAVAAEVLSFYQDRLANEGYLRTATERRSLVELGRLTGYAPRPGVSASVYLSYELDANAGRVTIPPGTRAQSVPGAGETMQTFETAEALDAHAEWSRLRVRLSQPVWRSSTDDDDPRYGVAVRGLTLAGTSTQLKANDALLIDYGTGDPKPYRVLAVVPDEASQTTQLRVRAWTATAGGDAGGSVAAKSLQGTRALVDALRTGLRVQPRDATRATRDKRTALRAGGEVYARALSRQSPALRDMLIPALRSFDAAGDALRPIAVYALRVKTGVFGSTAPNFVFGAPAVIGLNIADNPGPDAIAPTADAPGMANNANAQFVGTPVLYSLNIAFAWEGLKSIRDAGSADPVPLPELPLDGVHESIRPASGVAAPSWVLIDPPDEADIGTLPPQGTDDAVVRRVFSVTRNDTVTMTVGGSITAKATRLTTDGPWFRLKNSAIHSTDAKVVALLRDTQVYAQSERLPLARDPVAGPVRQLDGANERELELDGYYDGIEPGMWVIAAGDRADIADPKVTVPAAERAMITAVRHDVARVSWLGLSDANGNAIDDPRENSALPGDTLHTFVRLQTPLAYTYRRPSFVLHGNVVRATHGETRRETLGGGDATRPFQRFTLKSPPLTHVSAPTASGVASTLAVRVNRLLWHETADLATSPPDARVYATVRDEAEATSVRFGDGLHGARLPSGADNVTAVYRSGIGSAGNVRATQIALPTDKPLGVKGVTNPIRASGGAGPDTLRQLRDNAPLAVTALDRLVSVRDYEDFARTYAGIGKAAATTLRDGRRAVVHVTIAGIDDEPIDETSDLYLNLRASLRRYGDPHQPLVLQVRRALTLVVNAKIAIGADHDWTDVQPRVRAALLDGFGFAAAPLAQPVIVSRVLAAIEGVRGVDHVAALDVDALDEDALIERIDPAAVVSSTALSGAAGAASAWRRPWIDVATASVHGTAYTAAQIAYLPDDVPDTLILELVP